MKGLPITEHCDSAELDTRQRLELFLQVCRAVQHAHQKGVIHRDLKPSNVLVAMNDAEPVVKVIDFGIAKATGLQLTDNTLYTAFSQMVGTPLYISPEQAGHSNLEIDTRSDVYSLGVLLYELLTGETPFDLETLKQAGFEEMRRIIREIEPPKPSARISTLKAAGQSTLAQQHRVEPGRFSQLLRGELEWIVMKAMLLAALDAAWLAEPNLTWDRRFANDESLPLLRDALLAYGLRVDQDDPQLVAIQIRNKSDIVHSAIVAALYEWYSLLAPPIGVAFKEFGRVTYVSPESPAGRDGRLNKPDQATSRQTKQYHEAPHGRLESRLLNANHYRKRHLVCASPGCIHGRKDILRSIDTLRRLRGKVVKAISSKFWPDGNCSGRSNPTVGGRGEDSRNGCPTLDR